MGNDVVWIVTDKAVEAEVVRCDRDGRIEGESL